MEISHVRKPNAIIQAGQALSTSQSKMLFSMLSRFKYLAAAKPNLDELADEIYKFPLKEFLPHFCNGNPNGKAYDHVRRQIDGMVQQTLQVREGNKTKFYNLVSYAELTEGSSEVKACFNRKVLPLLVNMVEEGYTQIAFEDVFHMKGSYSIRLYELLQKNRKSRQVQKTGFYTISLEEFRFLLGVAPKKYPRWVDFRKRVLDPAKAEVEDKTDLRFSLEYGKTGRKITDLIFRDIVYVEPIVNKDGSIDPAEEVGAEQAVLDLAAPVAINPYLEDLQPHSQRTIEEKHSVEYIEYYYKKAKKVQEKGRLKSTFENCLYAFLMNDKDDFYNIEKRKQAKAEDKKKEAAAKVRIEKTVEKEKAVKIDEFQARLKKATMFFDNLDEGEKKKRIEAQKKFTPFASFPLIRKNAILAYADEVGL